MRQIDSDKPLNVENTVNDAQSSVKVNTSQRYNTAVPKVKQDYDKLVISNDTKILDANISILRRNERQFEVDKELKQVIIKIVNADTKELIRQIPAEHVIKLSKSIQKMLGNLGKQP